MHSTMEKNINLYYYFNMIIIILQETYSNQVVIFILADTVISVKMDVLLTKAMMAQIVV